MVMEKERCTIKVHRTDEQNLVYTKRLNRIEGQVKGISKMVNSDRHCDEILIQIAAVTKALKSLGQELLESHMKTCMVEDIKREKFESVDEVMDLFRKLV